MQKDSLIILMLLLLVRSSPAVAEPRRPSPSLAPEQPEVQMGEDLKASFDFEETTLNGQTKSPPGLSLNGRSEQSKTQMVNLRRNFREKLIESKPAVEASGRTVVPARD